MFYRQICLQIDQFEFDFKRNASGRTSIYEFTPHPQLAFKLPPCITGSEWGFTITKKKQQFIKTKIKS